MLLGIVLAAALGCAKLGGLEGLDAYKPTVKFDRVDVGAVTWQGADADFRFTVTNPNPVAVKVASFTYDLDLGGKDFVQGDDDDGMTLSARGDSALAIPVRLEWADVLSVAGALSGQDQVPFSISGDFGFQTPLGTVKIPWSHEGNLPVLQAPGVTLQAARVAGLDIRTQTARLEVDLGLENKGHSNLSFADLDYALSLSGTAVASGTVASVGGVSGGDSRTVTLPVDVELLKLGASVVNAITRKEPVQVGVTASVDVQTPLGTLPLSIREAGELPLR
ncbi:LEA type 2 family protein [Myxococcota bacterium]|nr:LEA type 2 family protein [Myxococcota bacterium]